MHKIIAWIDARFPLLSTWRMYFSNYYVPKNLNFYYYFGAFALVILMNQVLSGLWLTMFYTPTIKEAFDSINILMRDVNYGWLFRYMHTTGASVFFVVLYIHIFRSLLYGSYQRPRELVWLLGMALFLLLIAEAFFGYVLPWGQMSYWSAEVITSLLSIIPYVGDNLVIWLRGDYGVGNATLQRFFALHVIGVPLLVIFLVFLHVVSLHKVGSNNPQGIEINENLDSCGNPQDGIPFYPNYLLKECVAVCIFLSVFFLIVCFCPDMGGYFLEPDNFLPANNLNTPEHMAPLWYMSPFYAMLRAIPDKSIGIVLMFSAIFIWFFLPWLDCSPVRAMRYKGVYSRLALFLFVLSFLLLSFLGLKDITLINLYASRICILLYFAYFLLMPLYTRRERHKCVPRRIVSE